MTWDLRAALLKKGEVESARLDDFAFRLRARTMKLLAVSIASAEASSLLEAVARSDDQAILNDLLARVSALSGDDLMRAYERSRAEAERQLKTELGDPAPHRLA